MIPLELNDDLRGFSGRTPLFPLPNLVHFPGILLPLHIFEERYRRMVEDALAGERLVSMGLLKPGWETRFDSKKAPTFRTVCVGRITTEQKLPDGRFVLLLQGLARAHIVSEVETDLPYRIASLELQKDCYFAPPVIERDNRRGEILSLFHTLFPQVDLDHILQDAQVASFPLGILCDVLAYAMPLEPPQSQRLLETLDVDARSDLLLSYLRETMLSRKAQTPADDFPPAFSAN